MVHRLLEVDKQLVLGIIRRTFLLVNSYPRLTVCYLQHRCPNLTLHSGCLEKWNSSHGTSVIEDDL
jgi:hypothetical protein